MTTFLLGLVAGTHLMMQSAAQSSPISPCLALPCQSNPCEAFAAWYQAVGVMPYCSGHTLTQCVIVQSCNTNCYAEFIDLQTGETIPDCHIIYNYSPAPPSWPTTSTPSPVTSSTVNPNPIQSTNNGNAPSSTSPRPPAPITPAPTTTTPAPITPAPTTPAPTTLTPTAPTSPVTVQIWFDPMSNTDLWEVPTPARVTSLQSIAYCTSVDCVRVSGVEGQDTSIIRSAPNDYDSYTLTLDVVLIQMELNDYCQMYSKFGSNGVWQKLGSYRGGTEGIRKYRESSYTFSNSDPSANLLYIKLETAGANSRGLDFCFFDNVYLFGTGRAVAAQSNAVVAAKKAFNPIEHDTVNQELDEAQDSYGEYFSLESTTSILIWVSLLSIWCMACALLCCCKAQKSQPPVVESVDTMEMSEGQNAEEDEDQRHILPDTPPLPEEV